MSSLRIHTFIYIYIHTHTHTSLSLSRPLFHQHYHTPSCSHDIRLLPVGHFGCIVPDRKWLFALSFHLLCHVLFTSRAVDSLFTNAFLLFTTSLSFRFLLKLASPSSARTHFIMYIAQSLLNPIIVHPPSLFRSLLTVHTRIQVHCESLPSCTSSVASRSFNRFNRQNTLPFTITSLSPFVSLSLLIQFICIHSIGSIQSIDCFSSLSNSLSLSYSTFEFDDSIQTYRSSNKPPLLQYKLFFC
jgi:hypothetical protein